MDSIPDLFFVKGQNEGSPHIYRVSHGYLGDPAHASFVGNQNTEPLVLEALLIYIQQEGIDSRILSLPGIRPFLHEFAPEYKIRCAKPSYANSESPKLLKIPRLGEERTPALEVIRPIPTYGGEYFLSICDRKLVFVKGDNPGGAFTVASDEVDPLIKALFTADGTLTRPEELANILDQEYSFFCARQLQKGRGV